jgi:hypothetical protein
LRCTQVQKEIVGIPWSKSKVIQRIPRHWPQKTQTSNKKLEDIKRAKMTAEKKLKRKKILSRIAEKVVNACLLATISLAFAEITMTMLIFLL